ncbi:MAG: lipocalin family protein [Caulobacteraceae bacterium]|nr:lipocalin family protein [Caulobacteraceae bacterium]
MKRRLAAALCLAPLLVRAAAPEPTRPVPPSLYQGRWFEIAGTPTPRERSCRASMFDFRPRAGGFTLVQSCHRGSANGPVRQIVEAGAVIPGTGGAKFKLAFLGGLVRQDYWILDTAPDGAWAILATPGGHYVWILARSPVLTAVAAAEARRRVLALGYPSSRLAPSREP